jgi:aryl-alcohol dehydrogenase-like predicted oxidoreductase
VVPRASCRRIWARSPITIPIPGFRTVAQAEQNAHAMALGPLSDQQMREVDRLLHQQART